MHRHHTLALLALFALLCLVQLAPATQAQDTETTVYLPQLDTQPGVDVVWYDITVDGGVYWIIGEVQNNTTEPIYNPLVRATGVEFCYDYGTDSVDTTLVSYLAPGARAPFRLYAWIGVCEPLRIRGVAWNNSPPNPPVYELTIAHQEMDMENRQVIIDIRNDTTSLIRSIRIAAVFYGEDPDFLTEQVYNVNGRTVSDTLAPGETKRYELPYGFNAYQLDLSLTRAVAQAQGNP